MITDQKKPGTTNLTLSGNRGVSILITTFCERKCARLINFIVCYIDHRLFVLIFQASVALLPLPL